MRSNIIFYFMQRSQTLFILVTLYLHHTYQQQPATAAAVAALLYMTNIDWDDYWVLSTTLDSSVQSAKAWELLCSELSRDGGLHSGRTARALQSVRRPQHYRTPSKQHSTAATESGSSWLWRPPSFSSFVLSLQSCSLSSFLQWRRPPTSGGFIVLDFQAAVWGRFILPKSQMMASANPGSTGEFDSVTSCLCRYYSLTAKNRFFIHF